MILFFSVSVYGEEKLVETYVESNYKEY